MNTAQIHTEPLSIVIADDSVLLREGLAGLLERRGHHVIAQLGTATELLEFFTQDQSHECEPDLLITDVRMPPNMTDDGLRAALEIRKIRPQLGIIVLSQYVAHTYAVELFDKATSGTGYLLKDRVSEVKNFLDTLYMVVSGGTVIDPTVAGALISAQRTGLGSLSPREKEVLGLMARGQSNREISKELVLSQAAVAKHVSSIFMKLQLPATEENRRVKAILEYLAQPI
ncbi:response regulator transcription factor [Corynebacterium sp. sy017]|uniref:response regulator transcription factor n=1 Tax=unclassified Corynebacterium TaxID=2624378 RepID=UPI001185E852|nr:MULTISPECIES: response regulator transcription factor [unclassified Corynebacterium]MBP3089145.1 response regulator transcription factor [Corynebacterium sp. sy017]QDZ42500.1 response regulator transcription factor [Corynebacterium sp. sy039]TSD91457.1 response regulator transcription factor [Corynebacterium sp. SY003]